MLITLIFGLVVAREFRVNSEGQTHSGTHSGTYFLRFDHNQQCLQGDYQSFQQLKANFPAFAQLIDAKLQPKPSSLACHDLSNRSFFTLYRYGNWCGMKYGGFDNHCVDYCRQDQWTPSQDCLKCNPPTDYVDAQCMYHDFCMERFQYYHLGDASACNNTHTVGQYFPSPCACPMNITAHLTPQLLK